MPLPSLALQTFDHPFPYGLNIEEQEAIKVAQICPKIKILNLVSLDKALSSFSHFEYLTKATIEMEDSFGLGLCKFLQLRGHQLKEFTISCGTDADSTFLEGGGRSFQLFNVGLKLCMTYCPQLTLLSISGCGLVSNELLTFVEENPGLTAMRLRQRTARFLQQLKTLVLLTYYDVDETPIQTCEEELLFNVLRSKYTFWHQCRKVPKCLIGIYDYEGFKCIFFRHCAKICSFPGASKLECLSLEGNFSNYLSDGFFEKLLLINPLNKLRIFDVQGTQVPLSIVTAKRFLRLPDLRELRVSCWRLSEQEYKNLGDTIRMSGWDLRLSRRSTTQHAD